MLRVLNTYYLLEEDRNEVVVVYGLDECESLNSLYLVLLLGFECIGEVLEPVLV